MKQIFEVLRFGAVAAAIVVGLSVLPVHAAIQLGSAPSISLTPQSTIDSMCTAVNWFFYVLIVISVIMVLTAGYLFATAGDDTEKVSKARKTILYAAIGIFVALIAKGFPALIGSFFGGVKVPSC